MTPVERKLDEAKYFLSKLKPSYPFFDYILSAFLNAARSTTWVMRNQFNHISEWRNWFETCKITNNEKQLLKNINQLRIASSKQSGVKTDFYFIENIVLEEEYYHTMATMLKELEGEELEITISDEITDEEQNDEDDYTFRGSVKMTADEKNPSREALLNICSEYWIFLEKHVEYCMSHFGKNSQ